MSAYDSSVLRSCGLSALQGQQRATHLNSDGGWVREPAKSVGGDDPGPDRDGVAHGPHGVVGRELVDEALDAHERSDGFEVLEFLDLVESLNAFTHLIYTVGTNIVYDEL